MATYGNIAKLHKAARVVKDPHIPPATSQESHQSFEGRWVDLHAHFFQAFSEFTSAAKSWPWISMDQTDSFP
jgi:hypothetical protein